MTPTKERNKLIAEFMELYLIKGEKYPFGHPITKVNFKEARYHYSWDWLMPVVEKILFKTGDNHAQFDTMIISALSEVNIKSVWQAVIQFITWYNQQNPKQ